MMLDRLVKPRRPELGAVGSHQSRSGPDLRRDGGRRQKDQDRFTRSLRTCAKKSGGRGAPGLSLENMMDQAMETRVGEPLPTFDAEAFDAQLKADARESSKARRRPRRGSDPAQSREDPRRSLDFTPARLGRRSETAIPNTARVSPMAIDFRTRFETALRTAASLPVGVAGRDEEDAAGLAPRGDGLPRRAPRHRRRRPRGPLHLRTPGSRTCRRVRS